jgi:para-nitrobenzyl esterase
VVATTSGLVRGSTVGGVTAFLGIPFAAPPIGALRWRPPQLPEPWAGELDATSWPPPCPQKGDEDAIGDEDCLYLNVWAPEGAEPGSLPVLCFIHGGGNVSGSTSVVQAGTHLYEGDTLAGRGTVVVVTTQYRIGALGYLVHPALDAGSSRGISGNYGLLDQQAALRWVQANIESFGGDPSEVLLFGESGGATDTLMQLVSPLAAGLFSRALMESGGNQAKPSWQRTSEGVAFAGAAGCSETVTAEECLRARTPAELVTAVDDIGFSGTISNGIVSTYFGPTVDGWVLPEDPAQALADGHFNHVPFVVGANADEMRAQVPELGQAGYETLVRVLLAPWGPAAVERALQLYPVGAAGYATPTDAYAALVSDPQFVCPTRRFASLATRGQSEPVYRYLFSRGLQGPVFGPYGAFHGLELFFVFQRLERMTIYVPRAEDLELQRQILELWTSFAATGVPSASGGPVWPVYDVEGDPYLELKAPIATGQGVRTEKCDFWDTLQARPPQAPRRALRRLVPTSP